MARLLAAGDASITTAGSLLIDTPYPFSKSPIDSTLIYTMGHDPAPLRNLPDLVQKSIARHDVVLENWNLPTWDREGSENADSALKPTCPPPAILVRCKEFVNDQEDASNFCLVDRHRSEKLLGWEDGHHSFINAVFEVDANHYNIFDINDGSKVRKHRFVLDITNYLHRWKA